MEGSEELLVQIKVIDFEGSTSLFGKGETIVRAIASCERIVSARSADRKECMVVRGMVLDRLRLCEDSKSD